MNQAGWGGVDAGWSPGERVVVVDGIAVLANRSSKWRGSRGTIVDGDIQLDDDGYYIWVVFDGVPDRYRIPTFRLRKLDAIECLAELVKEMGHDRPCYEEGY